MPSLFQRASSYGKVWLCLALDVRSVVEFLTLRVSPPAHPETVPRRGEVIWDVREHT